MERYKVINDRLRENNYDLLRIISVIGVIVIHVAIPFMSFKNGIVVSFVYSSLGRFAVPCFVMLSGAFLLSNDENGKYKEFYIKSFKKIGITTIIFSFFYILYAIFRNEGSILDILTNAIKGEPYYHMWYLYMIIGLYLVTPMIIKIKKEIGEKKFSRVAILIFVLSYISGTFSTHEIKWDFGYSFCYLGYYIAGYVIRAKSLNKKSNIKGIMYLIAGFATIIIGVFAIILYNKEIDVLKQVEPFGISIVISSLLIFKGFSLIDIKFNFKKLSDLTMLIYLFHAGVWDTIKKIMIKYSIVPLNILLYITMLIVITFIISVILSVIYKYIYDSIEQKVKNRVIQGN